MGDFSGDIGGGHQIAVTAWRIIYDDVMLHVAKTAMTEMFFKEFDIHSEEEFLDTVSMYEDPDKFDRFVMRLIDFFFAAADLTSLSRLDVGRRLQSFQPGCADRY